MTTLNKQIDMPELKNTLMEFQRQSEMMDMKQEVCINIICAVNSLDDG